MRNGNAAAVRRLLGTALAALLVAAGVGCGDDGDGAPARPPGALSAALAYLPADSGLAVVVATGGEGAAARRPVLDSRAGRGARAVVEASLARTGLDFDRDLRSQLDGPFALGIGATDEALGAVQVKSVAAVRQAVERRLRAGSADRRDDYRDAFVWYAKKGTRNDRRVAGFGALAANVLVVASSEEDLRKAIDAGHGSDGVAYNDAWTAALRRLGDESLLRAVGDVRRLIGDDPGDAAGLVRVRWVRSLGLLTARLRPRGDGASVEIDVSSRRERLTKDDLPLATGRASPRLHDPDAPASLAVRDPDQLSRFLELALGATDPDTYSRYRSAVGSLRSLLRIDVHRDLLQRMTSFSIAFPGAAEATFRAQLERGAGPSVRRTLIRAQPALEFGIGDFLPGTTLSGDGSPSWEIKRGRLTVARYAVRGDAVVGSIGLGRLPGPSRGTRLRGVEGSLVVKGDLRRIASTVGLFLDVPEESLRIVSQLGDLTLGVSVDTNGLSGRGRLEPR